MASVPRTLLLRHGVLTSAAALDEEYVGIEVTVVHSDVDALAVMEKCDRRRKASRDSLIHGTMYSVYTSHMGATARSRIVIEHESHRCSEHCTMLPVNATVFNVCTDWVHVCVDGVRCDAPNEFHRSSGKHRVEMQMFVCDTTNKPHVCTPVHCTYAHDSGTARTCVLTGKVLGESPGIYSIGWMEDAWRVSTSAVHYNETVTKEVNVGRLRAELSAPSSGRGGASQRNRHRRRASANTPVAKPSRHSVCNAVMSEFVQLLRTKEIATDDQRKLDEIVSILNGVAAEKIAKLLPSSDVSIRLERERRYRTTKTMLGCMEKYIKKCTQSKCMILSSVLDSIYRTTVEWRSDARSDIVVHMDREKEEQISANYAVVLVKYLCALLTHTDFHPTDTRYADYVCAMLYLLQGKFSVDGITIFASHEFLQRLPLASQLDEYGYGSSAFTTAKGSIVNAITKAMQLGANPASLVFPIVPFSELFV